MRYSTAVQVIASALKKNPQQAIYMSGPPGVGKTTLQYAVADAISVPRNRAVIFRPSLRDPVDLNA